MLPEKMIPARLEGSRVVPSFLGAGDRAWVRALVDEVDRFSGRTVGELESRLDEPLPCEAPPFKARATTRLLLRMWRGFVEAPLAPPVVREAVFARASAHPEASCDEVFAAAAERLGVSGDVIRECLFADLPGERIVRRPESRPTPEEVLLGTNQLIAKSLLARATLVHVRVERGVAPVVLAAKDKGLLCNVEERSPQVLHISGPFALFRRTLLYARALGELLDALAWCGEFDLHADCFLRGARGELRLSSLDPIFPGAPPQKRDGKLTARFAKQLSRVASEWELLADPEPVGADGTLIFADFALRHRDDGRRFLVEIVGFWTPEYVEKKLARIRAAGLANLILCVDEERRCGDGEVAPDARLVRFRRRLLPDAVLTAMREYSG